MHKYRIAFVIAFLPRRFIKLSRRLLTYYILRSNRNYIYVSRYYSRWDLQIVITVSLFRFESRFALISLYRVSNLKFEVGEGAPEVCRLAPVPRNINGGAMRAKAAKKQWHFMKIVKSPFEVFAPRTSQPENHRSRIYIRFPYRAATRRPCVIDRTSSFFPRTLFKRRLTKLCGTLKDRYGSFFPVSFRTFGILSFCHVLCITFLHLLEVVTSL